VLLKFSAWPWRETSSDFHNRIKPLGKTPVSVTLAVPMRMNFQSLRDKWRRIWSSLNGRRAASNALRELIREVEGSEGYARNDVRAKAKIWLVGHLSSLDDEDILLARENFGYLLPAQWGLPAAKSLWSDT